MDETYQVPGRKTCAKCGRPLFKVIPYKTTAQQIIEFAKNSEAWKGNPDALDGWMPSGIFCPNGCTAIHADYPLPGPPPEEPPPLVIYGVFIESPGPKRLEIMALLRRLRGLTLQQAKQAIDDPALCIAKGEAHELDRLTPALRDMGATVTVRLYQGEPEIASTEQTAPVRPDESDDFSWWGMAAFLVPVTVIVLHFIFPHIAWLKVIANIIVIMSGALAISFLGRWLESGRPASDRISFQIPFLPALLLIIPGAVLTLFFGWYSTIALLAAYACLAITIALLTRDK